MSADRRVGTVDEVPADGSLLVTCEDGEGTEREVILLREETSGAGGEGGEGREDGEGGEGRADGEGGSPAVVAWENHCQHWIDVRLDRGDGVTRRNGELVCGKHGAMFEVDSGVCTYGPCEGAVLDDVAIEVRDGEVFIAEPNWSFAHLGPSEEREQSSRGGFGFS